MKIFVTGASGFVGRQVIAALDGAGEIHAVSTNPPAVSAVVRWHGANLLEPGASARLIEAVRPTHLLHLAWNAVPGVYWTTLDNLSWVRASLELLQAFNANGGERLVMAGTCAEYDWSHPLSIEGVTPTIPATLYGACKHALQEIVAATSRQTGLSSAWGRIFSLYGPHENPARLVSGVITALLEGREAPVGDPGVARDYLHVSDVASAFVALLTSDIQGAVNIASGEAVTVGQIVSALGEKTGRPDLIRLGAHSSPAGDPDCLIADITRLSSTGWRPAWSLDAGLDDTLAWWRTTLGSQPAC